MYTVQNRTDNIVINLTSNISAPLSLTFKRNGTTQSAINSTINDGVHNWTVPMSNYSVGDVLSAFTISTSAKKPWELEEGVTILIDGAEYDTIHSDNFKYTFDKADKYTIEAIFKGNDVLAMSTAGKQTFQVTQPTTTNPSPNPPSGKYLLEFVDKSLKTLTYNDGKNIEFRLTQGGHPVKGKTVEKVTPKSILSSDTNKNGIVSFTNTGYTAGTYSIGAYFYDYQDSSDKKIVDKVYKTITIKKAEPNITHNTVTTKGQNLYIYFRDNKNNRLPNEKVPIYINGKLNSKKTDKNGNVVIAMNNKGNFKFKVAYKGNKNLNKKTVSFNVKVK